MPVSFAASSFSTPLWVGKQSPTLSIQCHTWLRLCPMYRYQEKQAADVVAKLKGDIAMKARVVRNGTEQEIRARELVPGDIVRGASLCNFHLAINI